METPDGTQGGDEASAEPRWLDEREQHAWRTFLEVSRRLFHQLERDLQPFGLTMNDYEILVNLSEAPERRMRMSDLARATLQSKSRLSHQITRMESAGYVRRQNCESDRRGLYTVLTDHGWHTMRSVAPSHVASVRAHFIDQLGTQGLAAYQEAMQPVADRLRAEAS